MKIPKSATLLSLVIAISVFGTEPVVTATPPAGHTLVQVDGAERPKAAIRDMAWLAGQWQGPAFGGTSQEFWSEPVGGSMLGMYRSVKDNKAVFYELITIVEDAGSLLLKLKHFNPDLKGWEEKDEVLEFPLVKLTGSEIFFDGMTFRRDGKNSVTVFLRIVNKDGTWREETFVYRRIQ